MFYENTLLNQVKQEKDTTKAKEEKYGHFTNYRPGKDMPPEWENGMKKN